MKRVIRSSLKLILVKAFVEFALEKDHDSKQIEAYANGTVEEFERYLAAYNEFKED